MSPSLRKRRAACLTISGMGCGNCATRVRNSLLKIDAVHLVEIAVEEGLAVVAFEWVKVHPVDLGSIWRLCLFGCGDKGD